MQKGESPGGYLNAYRAQELKRLELDNRFDGDMVNFNPIFSDESRLAVKKYLNSKAAYLDSAGKLLNNPFHETLERILYSLTGDVK